MNSTKNVSSEVKSIQIYADIERNFILLVFGLVSSLDISYDPTIGLIFAAIKLWKLKIVV